MNTLLRITLATLLLVPLLRAAPANAGGIPDSRFGIIETYYAPAEASALGAGWTRVTFEWNQIQPHGPGDWVEFPVPDATLDAERAAGREVVGLLITTPGWATAQFGGKHVPSGLELPVDDPRNLWATFVRTLVGRHRGRIRHWIVWNEPDIWGSDFQSWGGTVEEFARLQEVAYLVAHEANPEAIIHLAAMTHWWDANYGHELYIRRLLNVLTTLPGAAEHNTYFDVFTLHLYFSADNIYDLSQLYYGILGEYGLRQPLWIAETNAPPSDDPTWPIQGAQFQISQEDQAAFVVQGLALALAGGAQRVALYKMIDLDDDRVNPEPFGLLRVDGSRRPACTSYRVATAYLAGFRQATLERRDTATVVSVRRVNGWTTVAWARGPEEVTVQVKAHAASARLVDWRGNVRWISARGGSYTVTLPASPCRQPANPCLIGGEPFLIVEGGLSAGAPPPADTALPTPTPLHSPTPTLTPTPTPPHSLTPTPPPSSPPTLPHSLTPIPPATPTPRPLRTRRPTRTPSPTPHPSPTLTSSPTPRPTRTPTLTPTPTPSLSPSPSPTPPPSPTPTPLHAPSLSLSLSLSSSPSPSPSPTPSLSLSLSPSHTPTPLPALALILGSIALVIILRRRRSNP